MSVFKYVKYYNINFYLKKIDIVKFLINALYLYLYFNKQNEQQKH